MGWLLDFVYKFFFFLLMVVCDFVFFGFVKIHFIDIILFKVCENWKVILFIG